MPDTLTCGTVKARCACILPPSHEGPHACDCGGVYQDGTVYALPVHKGLLDQGGAIAHQVACVRRGPMDVVRALTAMFGPFDDDED